MSRMGRIALETGPFVEDCDGEPGGDCCRCGGSGAFTETYEDAYGRDVDIDHECRHCEGEGVEPE